MVEVLVRSYIRAMSLLDNPCSNNEIQVSSRPVEAGQITMMRETCHFHLVAQAARLAIRLFCIQQGRKAAKTRGLKISLRDNYVDKRRIIRDLHMSFPPEALAAQPSALETGRTD